MVIRIASVAVRIGTGLLVLPVTSLLVTSLLVTLLLAAPGTAWAAGPSAATIRGPGIPGALILRADTQPDQFQTVLALVGWMAAAPGDPMSADPAKLGPRYIVDIIADGAPRQRYELYPNAVGGPRAFRPAGQPDGHATKAAWFYASVMSPENLAAAGVPVPGLPAGQAGGAGGPIIEPAAGGTAAGGTVSMGHAYRVFAVSYALCALLATLAIAGLAFVTRRPAPRGR